HHTDAVRIPPLVKPAPVVTPYRIHDETVIPIPVPYRISVPAGIWCISGPPAHILGKLPPVRPNFAPHFVVLKQLQYSARHLSERNPPGLEKHVAREPQRVTILHGIIGLRDNIL